MDSKYIKADTVLPYQSALVLRFKFCENDACFKSEANRFITKHYFEYIPIY